VVDQPVVQLSYKIVVTYFFPQDKSVKNAYVLISPTGEIKKLELEGH
jgi:hypothetical protein